MHTCQQCPQYATITIAVQCDVRLLRMMEPPAGWNTFETLLEERHSDTIGFRPRAMNVQVGHLISQVVRTNAWFKV